MRAPRNKPRPTKPRPTKRRTLEDRNAESLALTRKRIGDERVPDERTLMSALRALLPLVANACEALERSKTYDRLFLEIATPFIYATGQVTRAIDLTTGDVTAWQPSEDELPHVDDAKWRALFARKLRRLCAIGTAAIDRARKKRSAAPTSKTPAPRRRRPRRP